MKHSNVKVLLASFVAGFVIVGLINANKAHAEGAVKCIHHVTSTATDTQAMVDGGVACTWVAGAAVIMQCVDATVCYDPAVKNRQADGGLQKYSDAGIIGPQATTSDLCAYFPGDADPILLGLNPNEQNIGLILKSAQDGGATAVCKFAETRRRIPAP